MAVSDIYSKLEDQYHCDIKDTLTDLLWSLISTEKLSEEKRDKLWAVIQSDPDKFCEAFECGD